MDAEVEQLCWDCRVEHKVAMEESGQARGSGRDQPVSCEGKSNGRRTLRASESCTDVEQVAECDRSGYCWLPRLLGERCTDQASAETPGNRRLGVEGGVGSLHLQGHDPDPHTVEAQLWVFNC